MRGTIKNIQPSYYGFITDTNDVDYFFHGTSFVGDFERLRKSNPEGKEVEFNVVEHKRGLRAENVRLV